MAFLCQVERNLWICILILVLISSTNVSAKDVYVLPSSDLFSELHLTSQSGWKYQSGDQSEFAHPEFDDSDWEVLQPGDESEIQIPKELWKGVGWLRFRFKTDADFEQTNFVFELLSHGAVEFYLNGELIQTKGKPSATFSGQKLPGEYDEILPIISLKPDTEYVIAIRHSFHRAELIKRLTLGRPTNERSISLALHDVSHNDVLFSQSQNRLKVNTISLTVLLLVLLLHFTLYLKFRDEEGNLWVGLLSFYLFISLFVQYLITFTPLMEGWNYRLAISINNVMFFLFTSSIPYATSKLLGVPRKKWWKNLMYAAVLFPVLFILFPEQMHYPAVVLVLTLLYISLIFLACFQIVKKAKVLQRKDIWLITTALLSFPFFYLLIVFQLLVLDSQVEGFMLLSRILASISMPVLMSVYQMKKFIKLHGEMGILVKERTQELEEKNEKLEHANVEIEAQRDDVIRARDELSASLEKLKAAQDQLVQQEKLASLGQLTAGIAHEIKNPLNFVNNFSEVTIELVEEVREEVRQRSKGGGSKSDELILEILNDVEANLRKIYEHGSRADRIVKSMLQHSRSGDGGKSEVHLNSFLKEYVNLAFHGMRASENPINVDIMYELDESIGDVELMAEDFSRVILNMCNNAFDAMRTLSAERSAHGERYNPKLTIRTKSENGTIKIEIEDNGPGIPDEIKNKILQPFFTTKKGTQGTGLGLSITNDIVKAHGGTIYIKTKEDEGSTFIIELHV